jgi:hypothetical protein
VNTDPIDISMSQKETVDEEEKSQGVGRLLLPLRLATDAVTASGSPGIEAADAGRNE